MQVEELSPAREELYGLFRSRYPGGNAELQLQFCRSIADERIDTYRQMLIVMSAKSKRPTHKEPALDLT